MCGAGSVSADEITHAAKITAYLARKTCMIVHWNWKLVEHFSLFSMKINLLKEFFLKTKVFLNAVTHHVLPRFKILTLWFPENLWNEGKRVKARVRVLIKELFK